MRQTIEEPREGVIVKAKSPAKKFYPTGIVCLNKGCERVGVGDEYCSTDCAKKANGVAFLELPPIFAKSRKPWNNKKKQ